MYVSHPVGLIPFGHQNTRSSNLLWRTSVVWRNSQVAYRLGCDRRPTVPLSDVPELKSERISTHLMLVGSVSNASNGGAPIGPQLSLVCVAVNMSTLWTVLVQLARLSPPVLGPLLLARRGPLARPRLRFLFCRLRVLLILGGCEVFILKVP